MSATSDVTCTRLALRCLEATCIESLTEVLVTELRDRQLGEKPRGKPCAGMRGIIEEGDEHAGEEYETEALRDAVIIGSAMRVEHYEMAAYMGAIEHARILGQSTVRDLLEETLAEEQATDKKLEAIGQTVNPAAATGGLKIARAIAAAVSGAGASRAADQLAR